MSRYLSSRNYFEILNSFVDRDMFMRYIGGGVGHQDVIEVPRDEANENDIVGADYQGSDREGSDSENDSSDGDDDESSDGNSSNEDIEEWDPDDEDMGMDIDDDYGEL